MTTQTIVGYLYRDEYYCPACIVEAVSPGLPQWEQDEPERFLNADAHRIGYDRRGRHDLLLDQAFSQRDFPHTITSGQLDEPARCDTCMEEIR